MSYETMRLDVQGGIAALTFTKAETGNPINGSFCRDLYDVAVDLSERSDVRAVLIRAEGRAFGYGGDIAGFLPRLDELPRLMKQWTGDFHTGILRLQRLDAPIVVAVHGVCAGGMVALAAGRTSCWRATGRGLSRPIPGSGWPATAVLRFRWYTAWDAAIRAAS
ncbi:enoyl-CoA hydratase/isomerase family protein [Novosphingobium resinovorum]